MIYSEIPLKYQWVPINIDNDAFVCVFMGLFDGFLDSASKSLMSVLENEDGYYDNFREADILHFAEWAKDVYDNKEKVTPICNEWRKYVKKYQYSMDILNNFTFKNYEFDFKDHSTENINKGIIIYNNIIKKWKEIDFNLYEINER